MTEIRCKKCNRLLMKGLVACVEIKCAKCGYLNRYIAIKDDLLLILRNADNLMRMSIKFYEGKFIEKGTFPHLKMEIIEKGDITRTWIAS